MSPWSGDPDDHERLLATTPEPVVILPAEHSGQVPLETREAIEDRFKDGDLNVLVCTMTLELGVDLGQLLSVILRNVPPRPSNYAQRAGRAGRREERVALIVTFAGSGLPHDSLLLRPPGRDDPRRDPPARRSSWTTSGSSPATPAPSPWNCAARTCPPGWASSSPTIPRAT